METFDVGALSEVGTPRRAGGAALAVALLFAAAPGSAAAMERVGGTWTRLAPLPEARTELSAATDGRLIYIAGGFKAAVVRVAVIPRALHAYDPATDRWSRIGDIPRHLHHTGLAALGGRLYVVGGFHRTKTAPTGAVHILDLRTRAWRRGAAMPTPRGAAALAVHGGRIHVIGGYSGKGRSVAAHEAYDPVADRWERLAPMPTPRNHLAAAAVGGRIYAIGGRRGDDYRLTANEVYDTESGRWSRAPPLPTGRSGIAAAVLAGRVYVFGGEAFGPWTGTFDEAERFDPATGRWQALPPMPTARHGLGAVTLGGAIHVVGGGPRPGFAFSAAHERLTPVD